jgi:hypothetical protein
MKNKIRDYLWSISGHQKEIMLQTKIDGFRAVIIGSMLVMVGIYATLAWTFFFSTVTHNVFLSLMCGFFAGTFIVFFDRAIISTLSSGKRNLWALGFRFLLAILLGAFLAQPIILKVYERDIKREAVLLIDLKRQERKAELDKLYASEVSSLLKRRDELKALVDKQNQQMTEKANWPSQQHRQNIRVCLLHVRQLVQERAKAPDHPLGIEKSERKQSQYQPFHRRKDFRLALMVPKFAH